MNVQQDAPELTDERFVSAEHLPSESGMYWVKTKNDGVDVVVKRLFKKGSAPGSGAWFGGCRPFSLNDQISHYLNVPPEKQQRTEYVSRKPK